MPVSMPVSMSVSMPKACSLLVRIACLTLALTASAAAQDYPTKPVRLIIPFPPGGSNDVVGRMIALQLSDRLGKQVVVDNRGGGKLRARRLHPADHLDRACGQPLALQAALRSDQVVRAGRDPGQRPQR